MDVWRGVQKAGAGNGTRALACCGGGEEGDGEVATSALENTVDSGVLLDEREGGSVPLVCGHGYCVLRVKGAGCEGNVAGCRVEMVGG